MTRKNMKKTWGLGVMHLKQLKKIIYTFSRYILGDPQKKNKIQKIIEKPQRINTRAR